MDTWIPGSSISEAPAAGPTLRPSGLQRVAGRAGDLVRREPAGVLACVILIVFALFAVVPDAFTPYEPMAYQYRADRSLDALSPPSSKHWLGTTYYGRDVLSLTIAGSRVAIIVGIVSAFFIVLIGTHIGLIAGYYGGRVDDVLMRLTDVAFSIPFIPFALVLSGVFHPSLFNIIFSISILMWRTCARVIRAQVLSLKERPFVLAVRSAGGGPLRILYGHLLPNVLPLSLLYGAFGVAWSVIAEAGVSFLGFGDPLMVSWGQMIHSAFVTANIRHAWWWVVPPGLCIALFVVSCFLIGRVVEEIVFPRLREK